MSSFRHIYEFLLFDSVAIINNGSISKSKVCKLEIQMIKDTEYHELIDTLFISIEEALDECEVDIDYEGAGGILTLTMLDHTKIILNKQAPLHQLWVATKFNGHHFNYNDGVWIDERTGVEFFAFFDEAVSKQAGQPVKLNLQG
jgi:CyaY protein